MIFELSNAEFHDQVVLQLTTLGYMTAWSDSNATPARVYLLPRFMVWKRNIAFQQAIQEIRQAVNTVDDANLPARITLTKCITLNAFPWDGIAVAQ